MDCRIWNNLQIIHTFFIILSNALEIQSIYDKYFALNYGNIHNNMVILCLYMSLVPNFGRPSAGTVPNTIHSLTWLFHKVSLQINDMEYVCIGRISWHFHCHQMEYFEGLVHYQWSYCSTALSNQIIASPPTKFAIEFATCWPFSNCQARCWYPNNQ